MLVGSIGSTGYIELNCHASQHHVMRSLLNINYEEQEILKAQ